MRGNPLLQPGPGKFTGRIRLPMVQDIGGDTTRVWFASLRKRDDLRLVRTSQTQIAKGPLPSMQIFAIDPAGGPNSPASMQQGAMIANSKRLVDKNRGQSAGI
jgi:hypothetical protein